MKKYLYVLISASICLLLLEILIRISLFSNYFMTARFRQPAFYGDYFSDDDYWKLYYSLSRTNLLYYPPPNPKAIHPILGWSQVYISNDNPLGLMQESLGLVQSGKQKILFYGDSFVRGGADHDYQIPVYMTKHLDNAAVIDLSCGGYGLDQIFLMFEFTHRKIKHPHIFIGVLVDDDLDRSILSVRTGQKPYFILDNGKLALEGVPIDPDPRHYFEQNPPRIKSYIFRYLYRGVCSKFHLSEKKLNKVAQKIKINARIIEELNKICKEEGYYLEFILFYSRHNLRFECWQEKFIKDKLMELGVFYIDTKAILLKYADQHSIDLNEFYKLEGDGANHHNNLGNEAIAEGILNYLSERYNLKCR